MEAVLHNITGKLVFWHKKTLPIILQSEVAECGIACLVMIASYHGYEIDLATLRKRFNVSLEGTTLRNITQFAEQLELTSRPFRIELEDIPKLQAPCVLHWDLNHFVVLKRVSKNYVVIHDPAFGEKKLTMSELSSHFTGVAIEFKPTSKFEKKDVAVKIKLTDFFTRTLGLKKTLLLIFTQSLILQAFVLTNPYFLQLVVDDVILTADLSLLTVLALGFGLVLFFEILIFTLRGFTLLHFGHMLNTQLAANLFHHLVRLPMRYFANRSIGDVISRFNSVQQIRKLLTTAITEAVLDGIMAIITLAMMFFYSTQLALVVLISVSFYAILYLLSYKEIRSINEQEIIAKAGENSHFIESLRSIQVVKLFGLESKREGQWQNKFANATNQNIRLGNFSLAFHSTKRFLFGVQHILVIYFSANMVIHGGFSAGMLFAFIAYKQMFVGKASSLIEKLLEFKMLGVHLERLSDIVLTEKEVLHTSHSTIHAIQGNLSFDNVSFRYSEVSANIVNQLSLDIKSGESVAIVGPSGCGKSTVLRLMLGLDTPQSGSIYIDNTPLEQIDKSQFRSQVAAVMQNDEVLSGSIADNIAFFDANPDMAHIIHCAKLAAVHQDISNMAMGYNSMVGDMGSSLSGGQKQRIILARALYSRPKILFMDEATSHLDLALENQINHAVKCLKITRIIIAHRKETIASADRVISLTPKV